LKNARVNSPSPQGKIARSWTVKPIKCKRMQNDSKRNSISTSSKLFDALQFVTLTKMHLDFFREHSFFRKGGWARGIPMSMNVESPSPPFIFFVGNCDPRLGSSKIYSDPPLCCIKFMLTLPFWAGKKLMTLP